MVHIISTTLFALGALTLSVSGAPASSNSTSTKTTGVTIITLDDVKNSQPNIPEVSDPAKKAVAVGANSDFNLLDLRKDLKEKVSDAKGKIPELEKDDKISKNDSKVESRGLEKRWNEECYIFSDPQNPLVQATPAALSWSINHACKKWFPENREYYVPEDSSRYAYYFNHLELSYHVRRTDSPYPWWIPEYYATSQEVCISQLSWLVYLAQDGLCAGDMSGVKSEGDTSVPIWYSWRTY